VSSTGYATRPAKPRSAPPRPGFQLRNPRRTWRITIGILIALLFAIPVAYVVMISFESQGHFVRSPLTPPSSPTFSNFSAAWTQGDLGPQVLNTILYSVLAAAISVALSLLIAFPVARRLIRGSTFIYRTFVIGVCIPLPVIPLFIEAQRLDLYNSRIGYILLHVEPGLPLGVILLTAFVMSVPEDLDEAAYLEGCSYLRYLVRIVAPLAWPSIVIAFLYSLLQVWNDIIGPVVFLADPGLFPVTRGVYNFYGANVSAYTILAAAVVIVSLPVVALFIASQRQLLRASVVASR
jgi:raffinose/stachyose/melibiose transport system permease protein